MGSSIFILNIRLYFPIRFARHWGLFHTSIHILDHISHLPIVFISLSECRSQVSVHLLCLSNHLVSFGEFLFYSIKLLWVSKCIFWANHVFELGSQSCAFFDIHLDLYFDFRKLRTFDVTHEGFDLLLLLLVFSVQIPDLALQVNDEVSLGFQTATWSPTVQIH